MDESSALGVPAEAREALVFALLAWWHERNHPGNVPAVTGASRETVLGVRVNQPDQATCSNQADEVAIAVGLPQTAGLLRFQSRPQAFLAGRDRADASSSCSWRCTPCWISTRAMLLTVRDSSSAMAVKRAPRSSGRTT